MKRVLALILTVLMLAALFPASVITQAETVTKEGFYYVNWDRSFDNGDYDYVYSMPYTWINASALKDDVEHINIGVYFNGYSTSNVEAAAAELYDEFQKVPAGARYLNLAAMGSVFNRFCEAAVDMEQGVALVRDWVERFLDEYKSLGGELDGIAIDLEYNYAYNFYIESYHYNNSDTAKRNRNIYNDIVANPVYQNRIRPQLVEFEKQGLWKFYQNPNPTKYPDRSEIWTMYRYDSSGGDATCRSTWNWVINNLLTEYIDEAVTQPMLERYPNAILSDYSRGDSYSWYKSMSNSGGATGTSVRVGNSSNGVYYGSQFSEYYWASYSGSKTRQQYLKPVSYNKTVFDPTDKYTRALYDVNNQKRLLSSTIDKMGEEDAKVNVWMPFFYYANMEKSYGWDPYFAEVFYHMGMTNPQPYFGYTIKSEVESRMDWKNDADAGDFLYALKVNDELLKELTRVAGASDRKPIETPLAWNEGYILSGMYAGGRNIWRITPDTSKVPLEEFKVNDYAPTFRAGNVTITFPQGRIIQDTAISKIGTCGYWVETPANVTPVVTSTENRYANDPAFKETFTNYNVGPFAASSSSMKETTSGRPDTYWTVKGTAEIKDNSGDQVLALTGTTTLTNAKMAEHVTAGDYYAKQQIWETRVTLPSGNYGAVTLLSCHTLDGGVKISGGKVYYDQGGSYQELSGVTLAAGTYIVKREVDFRNGNTSSYTILDASGNRLGGTQMVPMAAITVPVVNITFSTTGAEAAVELDDYKLYPVGVSTTLDLYETSRGRKITDISAARTEDTGYRLSWMNAGNTYQVARIFDMKTGAIIETIAMAPGTDGVAAGLVKASAGQQIQIAVNVKEETAPAQIDYNKGDFSWTAEAAERIGLAVGQKLAYSGGGTTPDNTEKEEEGGNIFDIVGGNGDDLNNGSGDPIIGEGAGAENPGDAEIPSEAPGGEIPEEPAKKGLGGGVIALIVVLSLAIVAGGGFAAYIFIIKPKLAAKATQQTPEEEPWQDSEE